MGVRKSGKIQILARLYFRSKHKYFGTEMDKMKENDMYNFIYLKIRGGLRLYV